MNNVTQLDSVLKSIKCFKTSPIQSLLGIIKAKKLIKQGEHSHAWQNPEKYIADLETNFLTLGAFNNDPKTSLLNIMNDLKNTILTYQNAHVSAYNCHYELQQTYALITEFANQCELPLRSKILAVKHYNEQLLKQESYSYTLLTQSCQRIINILRN